MPAPKLSRLEKRGLYAAGALRPVVDCELI